MHVELLIEDASGERLMQLLVPQILGEWGNPHTWRLHAFKGVGRIPKGLKTTGDPAKRILLEQLPKLLGGYARTPGIDAVVIVLDTDGRNCVDLLKELRALLASCNPRPNAMFRLAIEEIEAWYLGDTGAILQAYPRAKRDVLNRYVQDSVCGTWELLADAIYPGGSAALRKLGWPLPGQVKHEWAETIGPFMSLAENRSPSFGKFRDGLARLAA